MKLVKNRTGSLKPHPVAREKRGELSIAADNVFAHSRNNLDSKKIISEYHTDYQIVTDLVKEAKLKSPFMAIRSSYLDSVLDLFSRHVPFIDLYYAMKSNPSKQLVNYLLKSGMGLDAASANELKLAIELGCKGDRIIVSNPFKNEALLHEMYSNNVGTFSIDSPGELVKIARFRDKYFPNNNICRPLIRVTVPTQGIEVDLSKKFGCSSIEAINLIRLSIDLGFSPVGLSFHVGTQCLHPETYGWAVDICRSIAEEADSKLGWKLDKIDIGGGFCSPSRAKSAGVSHEEYFSNLSKVLEECLDKLRNSPNKNITLIAEPGRIFSSGAGIAIAQVVGRVDRPEGLAVYLDDGVYGCFSTKLVEDIEYEFNCVMQVEKEYRRKIPSIVFGPTCDSIDKISQGALLPSNLEIGDYLFASGVGAYSISTACSFNGFEPPSVYFLNERELHYEAITDSGEVVYVQGSSERRFVANLESDRK